MRKKKVFIDLGHGGHDPGAVWDGLKEKDIVLSIGRHMNDILKSDNLVDFKFSRLTDVFIPLKASQGKTRMAMANEYNPDIVLSVHVNSADSTTAIGLETLYYGVVRNGVVVRKSIAGEKLAADIQKALKDAQLYNRDRGLKPRSDLAMLNHTNAPAALTEIGFIKNEKDRLLLINKQKEYAQALVNGIYSNLGVKKDNSDNNIENAPNETEDNSQNNSQGNDTDVSGGNSTNSTPKIYKYDKNSFKGFYGHPSQLYLTFSFEKDNDPARTVFQLSTPCINGVLFNGRANLKSAACSIFAVNNKPLGANAYTNFYGDTSVKRATMIYYDDGQLTIERINNIYEIKRSFKWAIGLGNIYPAYDNKIERWTGIHANVIRATQHSILVYKQGKTRADDLIYCLVNTKALHMDTLRQELMKTIPDMTSAGFLDGGGSSQFFLTNDFKYSSLAKPRALNTVIGMTGQVVL